VGEDEGVMCPLVSFGGLLAVDETRSGRACDRKTHIAVGVRQHVMCSIWNLA